MEILTYFTEVSSQDELFSVGHFFHSKYDKWLTKAKKKYRKSQTKGNHNNIKSYSIIFNLFATLKFVSTFKQTNFKCISLEESYDILDRLYYFLINELRDDNGCEDINKLSAKSWYEFEDDYDSDCEDSDEEYQVQTKNFKTKITYFGHLIQLTSKSKLIFSCNNMIISS